MNKSNALDEVLHSAQQMVNQYKLEYPPDWHAEATGIIKQAAAELAQLRADLAAAVEALQKIAGRGLVFDAKGTWSKEVNQIASDALARLDKGGEG